MTQAEIQNMTIALAATTISITIWMTIIKKIVKRKRPQLKRHTQTRRTTQRQSIGNYIDATQITKKYTFEDN